jgi:ESS family glutamate:Na+ symporter
MNSSQLFRLLLHLGGLGGFLMLGQALRASFRIFQNLFLPASLVGGAVALSLGPFGANCIPAEALKTWAALPETLISVVFACLLLGDKLPRLANIWGQAGAGVTFEYVQESAQWIIGLGVAALVIAPIWGLHPSVGTIIELGWSGGPGTAAGMVPVYQRFGHPEIAALGVASATVGLIYSIVMGIILINYATRKGYTSMLNSLGSFRTIGSSRLLGGGIDFEFGLVQGGRLVELFTAEGPAAGEPGGPWYGLRRRNWRIER